jgi:transcription initiation factor IIE alpha subunit
MFNVWSIGAGIGARRKRMNSIWLMVGKNTFMCPVCKAQITGNENIKYQRYCYWCGTKMTQDKEANNETN